MDSPEGSWYPYNMKSTHQRITHEGPIHQSTHPQIIGDVKTVTLECGHTFEGNPIFTYFLGNYTFCHDCDDENKRAKAAL
jgi:hypothetical protein